MIISHKHKFIFIKTVKTAGTSIEIALSKFCGSQDVITPITPEDEELRRRLGYRGPQNYVIPLKRYSLTDWWAAIRYRRRATFYNHVAASFVQAHADKETWNTYYKFCFDRNPWDKAVSYYYWRHKQEPRPSISEFVQNGGADAIPGYHLYTKNDDVIVDHVYQYEDLGEAMQEIAARCNLPEIPELVHAKGGFRQDKRNYRDLLDERSRERIASVNAQQISLLGYQW